MQFTWHVNVITGALLSTQLAPSALPCPTSVTLLQTLLKIQSPIFQVFQLILRSSHRSQTNVLVTSSVISIDAD